MNSGISIISQVVGDWYTSKQSVDFTLTFDILCGFGHSPIQSILQLLVAFLHSIYYGPYKLKKNVISMLGPYLNI